jgi:hypothetical protein
LETTDTVGSTAQERTEKREFAVGKIKIKKKKEKRKRKTLEQPKPVLLFRLF